MSVSGFIPQIWSASILRGFERASVFAGVLSREYSGEIKNVGDTVKVPMVGTVAIRDYTKRVPITYDDIQGSTLDITVDQSKYFGLKTEDIEAVQSAPNFLDGAVKNAAYALRDTIDKYSAEILKNGAGTTLYEDMPYPLAAGSAGDPQVVSTGKMLYLELLTEMAQVLDEKNVPREGRFAIVPPFMVRHISHDVIRNGTPNEKPISEYYIARLAGFDILMSNNLPADDEGNVYIVAGSRIAATHIIQIDKVETLRDTTQFGDLVRGLALYTSKVLLPDGVCTALTLNPINWETTP